MPNQNPELLDAAQFKNRLISRINKDDDEGQKIGEYLDEVVSDWKSMRATLLYKYIQDMLKDAKDARYSEMELVLKRAIQIIPLMVIFFTAFGYLGFIAYENIIRPIFIDWFDGEESEYFSNKGHFFLIFVLAIIADISVALSLVMVTINTHSYGWQENWKCHVDYLEAILGIKLTRACLGGGIKYSMITFLNIRLYYFIFIFWIIIVILFSALLIFLSFSSECQESLWFGFCDVVDMLTFIVAISATMLFTYLIIYMHSKFSPFFKQEENDDTEIKSIGIIINPLPKLFSLEGSIKKIVDKLASNHSSSI